MCRLNSHIGQVGAAADRDIYIEVSTLYPALADASQVWAFAVPVIDSTEAGVLRQ
jgi:hypothetical protein